MLDFLYESAVEDGDPIPEPHIFPYDASEEGADVASVVSA